MGLAATMLLGGEKVANKIVRETGHSYEIVKQGVVWRTEQACTFDVRLGSKVIKEEVTLIEFPKLIQKISPFKNLTTVMIEEEGPMYGLHYVIESDVTACK